MELQGAEAATAMSPPPDGNASGEALESRRTVPAVRNRVAEGGARRAVGLSWAHPTRERASLVIAFAPTRTGGR